MVNAVKNAPPFPQAPPAGAFSILAGLSPWLVVIPIALVTAIPILVVLASLTHPDQSIWDHL